jgi:hypothetical protein
VRVLILGYVCVLAFVWCDTGQRLERIGSLDPFQKTRATPETARALYLLARLSLLSSACGTVVSSIQSLNVRGLGIYRFKCYKGGNVSPGTPFIRRAHRGLANANK